jgi:hypothetical protein
MTRQNNREALPPQVVPNADWFLPENKKARAAHAALSRLSGRVTELEQEAKLQAINHEYVVEMHGALSSGVGLARLAFIDGRPEDARRYLDEAVEKCPDFGEYMERYDAARALAGSAGQEQA